QMIATPIKYVRQIQRPKQQQHEEAGREIDNHECEPQYIELSGFGRTDVRGQAYHSRRMQHQQNYRRGFSDTELPGGVHRTDFSLTGSRPPSCSNAASASRTGRTSCTRTIWTPCTANASAAPTVALVRSASLSPISLPKNPFREWPTNIKQPSSWK